MAALARVTAAGLLALCCSTSIPASSVANADLPASIQGCIASGMCLVTNESAYDSGTASAYAIAEVTASGVEENWLMRYELVPPSLQSHSQPGHSESLSGYLWMLAKGRYDAARPAHPITLMLDRITPTPFSFIGQEGDLSLFVPSADLLGGTSYISLRLDDGPQHGGLRGEYPLPCLADGCEVEARLNLAQLVYVDLGATLALSVFNPLDMRGLIYSQRSSYQSGDPFNDFNDAQSFHISAVPLVAPIWLSGAGIATLAGIACRARSRSGVRSGG